MLSVAVTCVGIASDGAAVYVGELSTNTSDTFFTADSASNIYYCLRNTTTGNLASCVSAPAQYNLYTMAMSPDLKTVCKFLHAAALADFSLKMQVACLGF